MATLGNASGASIDSGTGAGYVFVSGSAVGSGYLASEDGTITKITIKCQGPASGQNHVRAVVYSETAGLPATRICYAESKLMLSTDPLAEYDWTSLTPASPAIVNGTRYWIGFYTVDQTAAGFKFSYAAGASGIAKYKGAGVGDPPPDPFPASPSSDTEQAWAYITYTPSGAAVIFDQGVKPRR